MSKSQELYKRAKEIIPGGTQLLSKRPEMFAPEQWPNYFARAAGCEVWDLDGKHYYDMTSNGIGACLLGYADSDVNDAEDGGFQKWKPPSFVFLLLVFANIRSDILSNSLLCYLPFRQTVFLHPVLRW